MQPTSSVSIQFGDKTTKLAVETIDQLREQGVSLVDIGGDRHVVADNIKSAKPFTDKDAAKIEETWLQLSASDFKSRVETTAGAVLSSDDHAGTRSWIGAPAPRMVAGTGRAADGQRLDRRTLQSEIPLIGPLSNGRPFFLFRRQAQRCPWHSIVDAPFDPTRAT